jgi:hypothetical protein
MSTFQVDHSACRDEEYLAVMLAQQSYAVRLGRAAIQLAETESLQRRVRDQMYIKQTLSSHWRRGVADIHLRPCPQASEGCHCPHCIHSCTNGMFSVALLTLTASPHVDCDASKLMGECQRVFSEEKQS